MNKVKHQLTVLVTIGAFRHYLKHLPQDSVFKVADSRQCPIAQFVESARNSIYLNRAFVIRAGAYNLELGWFEFWQWPAWAREVIRRVDFPFEGSHGETITVAQVLQILEEVADANAILTRKG